MSESHTRNALWSAGMMQLTASSLAAASENSSLASEAVLVWRPALR